MLPELPAPLEAEVLEELDGRAEEEAALRLATVGDLRDRFDETAAGGRNLLERAFDREPRDPLPAVSLVDEDASDAPVGSRWGVAVTRPVVGAPVLDAGQLVGVAPLRPAVRQALVVDDEGRVGVAGADALFLGLPVVERFTLLEVPADAPAAAERRRPRSRRRAW